MPAISKIRFTNVIYENGAKRYNDMIFDFDGQNGAILLENGGGKTVFIQTAIQAIIPHIDMANRKIKDTLSLESGPAHIAIEWIINEHPRRYVITATSLFIEKNMLGSVKYVYEYSGKSENDIEKIPFSIMQQNGKKRPSSKGEISEYYHRMNNKCIQAKVFDGINEYGGYIEEHFKIVPSEWRKIALINSSEGNVDEFFNQCKTTTALLNNLLIPVVEEAIEGNQAKGFVDTFEKQRDHFKKNKYLQEKIAESKNVKGHIDDFVREFKDYDDCLKTYDDNKSKAKTLNRYLINLTEENEDNKKQNIDRKEKLINRKDEYNQKDLSYNILLLDEQLKEESDKLDIEEKLLSKYKEQINKLKSRKQNIEWTKLQNKIKINIEKIDFFKKKLKEFEKDISISELEDKLELNSSNIKGYYENELQIIIKDKQQLIAQKETYDREYSQINSKMDSIILKEDKVKEEIHRIEAQIEMLEKNMQQIADTMSLPLDTNNINGCIHDWKTRLTELENKMLDIIREKKELNTEIENKRVQREQTKENYYSTKLELEENKRELNQQRQEEEKLYQELIEHGQYINTHSNIYLKEESILQRLIEKQRLLNDNKEKSLLKERISKRLQDLYENMDVFCAEPVMEKIVNSLKNKIGYITIGSQYLQSLIHDGNFTKDILFDKYPYWAITIITTGKDKPVVEKKVESYKRELMYPIFIKTLDQIKSYMNYNDESNNIKEDKPVFPSIWIDNISRSEFIEWKSVNEKLAKETESIRKQNEQEYISCNDVLKHAKDFFITYPYEQISELEKNISDSEQKLISLKEKEEMINNIINQCSKDVVNIDNEKEKYMQEIRINEECVTRAIDFNNKNNDKNTKLKAYKSNNKLLQTYKNDKKLLQMEFDKIQDIIDDINTAISKLDNRKAIIIDNELYREIKNSDVNYSNMTLEVLCESRKSIKDRLRGLNFNRSTISDNLMREEENLSENTRSADYKSKEADFPLGLLNVYNEEEIEKLIITIKEISKEIKLVNNKINKINKIISKHKWKKEELLNELIKEDKSPCEFNIDINDIPQLLKVEKLEIKKLETNINREFDNIIARTELLENVNNKFQVENAKHNFLSETIKTEVLAEQILLDFNYQMIEIMKELSQELESDKNECDRKYNRIKLSREAFIDYCNLHINDSRLREMAVNGIKNKNEYKDLIEYQKNMAKTIVYTIKVAEDDRRESDIELQTFLTHVHSYLKSVAHELNVIQRKTSVKVDGENKQIFNFTIPDWEEAEGKEELRKYIDIIIDEFDREIENSSDEVSIRRLIEKKLSIKNLLNVVLKDKSIKIKCRKVTNDMKITKVPMSWESSNKWSGGERWSKNMTLFLGILNYLAEKKQHLNISQKNNRTVILDNPFGKASSKHVLEPVFFIAEKLGFQIIALTAHAQGKFISDYFPIVYSCRLRDAVGGERQIMTNERHINMAYLKEKSPLSVYRLQETEQLELL